MEMLMKRLKVKIKEIDLNDVNIGDTVFDGVKHMKVRLIDKINDNMFSLSVSSVTYAGEKYWVKRTYNVEGKILNEGYENNIIEIRKDKRNVRKN